MAVRAATEKDIPRMLEIYRPYVEQTAISFEWEVPTLAAFTHRFSEHTAFFPWYVWEEEHTVLAYAYGGRPFSRAAYAWCAEISVYVHMDCRRQGIGKQLYAAVERMLQQQGFAVIYAVITSENTQSVAFHEALGYQTVAVFPKCGYKFGRWHGVQWMEKRIGNAELPAEFPQDVHRCRQDGTDEGKRE